MKKLLLIVLTALMATSCTTGSYLNDAEVFAGLDKTNRWAAICEYHYTRDESVITGNLGVELNLYRSEQEIFETYVKWQHLSCANQPDFLNYDAYGIGARYKIWRRK